MSNIFLNEKDFVPPNIICSLNTAYTINDLLDLFKNTKKNLKLEILVSDIQKEKENLSYFLQDKLPELNFGKIPPKFSLVYPNYQINYSKLRTRRKKRNRKPPDSFQKIIKRFGNKYYPESIGNDYYGKKVFETYIKLRNLQGFNKNIPLPSSPLKYYDFQEKNNKSIEFRFRNYIQLEDLEKIIEFFENEIQNYQEKINFFRASIVYDRWISDLEQKIASTDQFYFSYRDFEFDFLVGNNYNLERIMNKNEQFLQAIYFKLTPPIETLDFRVEKIEKIFNTSIEPF